MLGGMTASGKKTSELSVVTDAAAHQSPKEGTVVSHAWDG